MMELNRPIATHAPHARAPLLDMVVASQRDRRQREQAQQPAWPRLPSRSSDPAKAPEHRGAV